DTPSHTPLPSSPTRRSSDLQTRNRNFNAGTRHGRPSQIVRQAECLLWLTVGTRPNLAMAGTVSFDGIWHGVQELFGAPGNTLFFLADHDHTGPLATQETRHRQPQLQFGTGLGQEHNHGIKAASLQPIRFVAKANLPVCVDSQCLKYAR